MASSPDGPDQCPGMQSLIRPHCGGGAGGRGQQDNGLIPAAFPRWLRAGNADSSLQKTPGNTNRHTPSAFVAQPPPSAPIPVAPEEVVNAFLPEVAEAEPLPVRRVHLRRCGRLRGQKDSLAAEPCFTPATA